MTAAEARRQLTRIARQMGYPDAAPLRGGARSGLLRRRRMVAAAALSRLGADDARIAAALGVAERTAARWRERIRAEDGRAAKLLAQHINGGHPCR